MLSARPGPLNPGATSPLSRHHLTRPSRAAGSFSGPKPSFATFFRTPETGHRAERVPMARRCFAVEGRHPFVDADLSG